MHRYSGAWYHSLAQLTLARMIESLREPAVAFYFSILLLPLIFALGIAYRDTPTGRLLVAVENSAPLEAITALSQSTNLQPILLTREEASKALRSGRVAVVVRVHDWPRQQPGPARSASPRFDYLYDPARAESVAARFAADDTLQRAAGRIDVASPHNEQQPSLPARYIDFLVPGLIGMILMGSGIWGLGFAVVQVRTRKLLKRLATTPMRRSHYPLSFMLSRLAFLTIEITTILVITYLFFGVRISGSLVAFATIALTGAMTSAGMGLLLAARARTIEGVSGLMNLVTLPMWILSGVFFPSSRFPQFFQPAIRALPLTALNESLRSVMIDGASLASNWAQICVMLIWGLISFTLALRLFRWK